MKPLLSGLLAVLLAAPALSGAQEPRAAGVAPAVAAAPAPNVPVIVSTTAPEIPFDGSDALHPPKDMYLGEVAGVAFNPKDKHLLVFQRGNTTGPAYGAAAAQLLEFDNTGKFVREIGKGLYAWSYAHAVRVDPEGNIWAVDKGSDMVIKFNPEGRVMMVFGRKPEASDEGAHPLAHPRPPLPAVDGQFRQVTDIAWDSRGNGYISDGYINSRVAKVDKAGHWLKSWGSYGKAPGQFDTLHSIAIDSKDQVYIADRGNRRIQVFDTEGKLLKIIQINIPAPPGAQAAIGATPRNIDFEGGGNGAMMPGAPWSLCITPMAGGKQFLYMSDAFPGRVYKLDMDGKVVGYLGQSGKQLKEFGWIHEMACPSENELYVGELLNWRLQKLILHPNP
jgi:hypothetical protein